MCLMEFNMFKVSRKGQSKRELDLPTRDAAKVSRTSERIAKEILKTSRTIEFKKIFGCEYDASCEFESR